MPQMMPVQTAPSIGPQRPATPAPVPQTPPDTLTDEQLLELITDPRTTAVRLQKLYPEERQRLEQLMRSGAAMPGGAAIGPAGRPTPPAAAPSTSSMLKSGALAVGDVGLGALKGLGESVFKGGQLVHRTPILGNVTDAIAKLLGPEGTDPDQAFAQMPPELASTSTAQHLGKFGEQVAEIGLLGKPARMAAIGGLVKAIPNSASPATMQVLNQVAAILGRSIGEGGAAGLSALAHEDPNPERAALIGASGPVAGAALGKATDFAAQAMNTKLGAEILPLLVAGTAMQAAGGLTPGGLGAGLGTWGTMRAGARQVLTDPQLTKKVKAIEQLVSLAAARSGAAASTQLGVDRRQSRQDYDRAQQERLRQLLEALQQSSAPEPRR